MYVVLGSVASANIDFEYTSMYRTRPSFSYSSYPGRTKAISSRTSAGPLSVSTHRIGEPFFRPSAMKRFTRTSFPTYAGPYTEALIPNGMPPNMRSSRRGMPVFTFCCFTSIWRSCSRASMSSEIRPCSRIRSSSIFWVRYFSFVRTSSSFWLIWPFSSSRRAFISSSSVEAPMAFASSTLRRSAWITFSPQEFLLLVRERLLDLPDLVVLRCEVLLEPLELLLLHEGRALPLEDVLLLAGERAPDLRLRLALERLGFDAELVVDLVLGDIALEADDPLLELLFLCEVVLLHLPELFLEPALQLLVRSATFLGTHLREAFFLRSEEGLVFGDVRLPLFEVPLVRLHLREPGFDLFFQRIVHRPQLGELGLERIPGLLPLIQPLLHLGRGAAFHLLRLHVLDDRDGALLDVLDLLLQFLPLRDLRLHLFRQGRGLLDVLDRIELPLAEVHELPVQGGAHRREFGSHAVYLEGLLAQLPDLVIGCPVARGAGRASAARGRR